MSSMARWTIALLAEQQEKLQIHTPGFGFNPFATKAFLNNNTGAIGFIWMVNVCTRHKPFQRKYSILYLKWFLHF